MKTKIVVFSICILLISVGFASVVNAQESKIKMKAAERIVEYCEKQMIPRYEQVVLDRIDRSIVESIYATICEDFKEISGGYSTTQIEIVLWLVALIIAFFTTMTGYNPVSYALCLFTVSVVCFIPAVLASILWGIIDTTVLGIGGALALFDVQAIQILIYDYGIAGAILFYMMLVPALMIVYLLAIPVVTIVNMILFSGMIINEVNEGFN